MVEYISKDKFIHFLFKEIAYFEETQTDIEIPISATLQSVVNEIKKFPSADVQPVKHGKNLDIETPSIFTCSVCGWHSWDTYCGDTSEYNYCPNCGTKMDGET